MFSLITLTSTALALSTLLLSTNANPTPVLQARDHFVSPQSPHPPAAYQTQTDSILSRSSTAWILIIQVSIFNQARPSHSGAPAPTYAPDATRAAAPPTSLTRTPSAMRHVSAWQRPRPRRKLRARRLVGRRPHSRRNLRYHSQPLDPLTRCPLPRRRQAVRGRSGWLRTWVQISQQSRSRIGVWVRRWIPPVRTGGLLS